MIRWGLFLLMTLSAQTLWAQEDFPSLYISSGVGLTTYKSEAVQSNDTTVSTGYSLGIRGGSDNQLSMDISSESSKTQFEYADLSQKSQIETVIQDTHMAYHLGWFYLGLMFSQMQLVSKYQDTEFLDNLSTGMGFHGGSFIPLNKGSFLFVDFSQSTPQVTKDIIQGKDNPVKMGARTEIFLGGLLRITRSLLSARIGYKQRNFSLTVDQKTYQEVQTMTWVGLDFNIFF